MNRALEAKRKENSCRSPATLVPHIETISQRDMDEYRLNGNGTFSASKISKDATIKKENKTNLQCEICKLSDPNYKACLKTINGFHEYAKNNKLTNSSNPYTNNYYAFVRSANRQCEQETWPESKRIQAGIICNPLSYVATNREVINQQTCTVDLESYFDNNKSRFDPNKENEFKKSLKENPCFKQAEAAKANGYIVSAEVTASANLIPNSQEAIKKSFFELANDRATYIKDLVGPDLASVGVTDIKTSSLGGNSAKAGVSKVQQDIESTDASIDSALNIQTLIDRYLSGSSGECPVAVEFGENDAINVRTVFKNGDLEEYKLAKLKFRFTSREQKPETNANITIDCFKPTVKCNSPETASSAN